MSMNNLQYKRTGIRVRKLLLPAALTGISIFSGCHHPAGGQEEGTLTDSVEVDTAFTALFSGDCDGFTGGDGTYSVALPDGRTIWLFGDTFIGGLNPDGTREVQDPLFIRNCAIVQDGTHMHTLFQEVNGKNASFAIPPVTSGNSAITEDSVWFWPGDGLVEGGRFRLFLSEFIKGDTGTWGFQWTGTWVGSYSLPELKEEKIEPLPFLSGLEIHFGHAVCETPDFTYVYGRGNGKPYAARYSAGDLHGSWEFFDGSGWSSDPFLARPMADTDVSEQFSVFTVGETYVMVTQGRWLSGEIWSYTSGTPYGPWGNGELLYTTPLPDTTHNLITYNALAHPQFTRNGKVLISYNTNSSVPEDHFRDAGIYRPRFVRVPLRMILGKDPDSEQHP